MIRWLTGLLGGAAERRLGDFLLGVAAAGVVALSAAISLGFGTFAVYAYLRASQGRVVAALIVCAAFGATAITIWAVAMARRRARRLRLAAMASASASVEDLNSILQHLVAAGAKQDQLAAAMRLGRELSPMQLFALALVGGFIAGKKLAK
jgi:Kef-type K+ transport system membrane component KefB